MGQSVMWMPQRRYETGDYPRILLDIVRDLESGIIRVPQFQREFVWPMSKREQFVKRLLDGRKPIGVIATYELAGDSDGIVFLNDGYQRLSTLRQLLHEPSQYGLSVGQSESLLRAFNFSVQHRVYASHDEAAEDYKDINQGTPLTALEFYKADLANVKDYDSVWRGRIDRLHDSIERCAIAICAKPQSERSVAHRYRRHDLSIFYRFASGETGVTHHGVNAKQASAVERQRKTYIEHKFSQWIQTHGVDAFDAKLKNLISIVENETAIIEAEYRKVQSNPGIRIGVVLYRWLLDVSVWRRNNKLDTELWLDFVRRFMQHTGGTQAFPGTTKKNAVIVIGDLGRLKLICQEIGSLMYEGEQARRAKRPSNAQPGYDVSHVLPFSVFGEGPAVMEPASINRARGAKPMDFSNE